MKKSSSGYILRASVIAVQGALAAFAMVQSASAADEVSDEVRELIERGSFVEIGAGYVSDNSYKFGEYNGLQNKGVYGIGGFEINGGERDSAFRWQVYGNNLGLETRSLGAEVGEQGSYRFSYGYDELRYNVTDSYSTPFFGTGSRNLVLPANYPAASTRLSVTNTAGGLLANWNNIQSPNATATTVGGGPAAIIPAAMHGFDVHTERYRHDVGLNWIIASNWDFKTSFRHEDKVGTKLTGVSEGFNLGMMLPEAINRTTDLFNATLGYKTEQGHFTVGYNGSLFRNSVDRWTAASPYANNVVINNLTLMSGAPDNQMHQLNLAGAYNFSKVTRLVVTGSYARLTQNEQFQYQSLTSGANAWSVPTSSADAKVVNTNFNARLTTRPMKDLGLTAAYKYENRDNQTPVRSFLTAGFDSTGRPSLYTTEPLNRRLHQVNLDADYNLGRGQGLRGGYEWQEIKRTADSEETPFRAETTRENTLRAEYRNSMGEDWSGRVAYAYSQRRSSNYEEGNPRPTDPAAPLPAADPFLPDFKQFYLADRNRDKLRTSVNYQATNAVSVQAALDYNRDDYNNSPYGLKESNSWVFNLDGAYTASENVTFNAYYTYEDIKARLESLSMARGKTASTLVSHVSGGACLPFTNVANTFPADYYTDPCREWTETQKDKVHTVGLGAKARELLGGKVELSGNLAYSFARTPISVTGGTYFNNGVPNSATGNVFIPAQSFPDITSNLLEFRLNGQYAIDKASAVRLGYIYRRLHSSDWQYDAFTNVLALQGYIGTTQTSPNYEVHVVGASYVYNFR